MGKIVKLRPDWEKIKNHVMLLILRHKFRPGTILDSALVCTDDATLIEGNSWHDNYWGRCDCKRCQTKTWFNHLGLLLMQVRQELNENPR